MKRVPQVREAHLGSFWSMILSEAKDLAFPATL
jgi:hypothetical protein